MPNETELPGGEPCDYLHWDSDFFGRRIARVRGECLSAGNIATILKWCAAQRIDCLYFLAASDDIQTVTLAESHGFRFVDIRITFEHPLKTIPAAPPGDVRLARLSDLDDLKRTARLSFHDSRFYYDPEFGRPVCDALYARWIEESCKGYADFVLVADVHGRPAGWATCHLGPDRAGSIGLIAVDPSYQGRGLAQVLVCSALRAFGDRRLHLATVVTQGRNVRSQRLYQRCGFITQSVKLWYHRSFAQSLLERRSGIPNSP